jgi:hypothetical protein
MKQSYQYAGLQNVHQLGMPVDECVSRLHCLAYVEERLMLLEAAHIVSCPEWDVKILLGRLQYEDSQHADQLKTRLTELRVAKTKAYKPPSDALKLVFDEAMHSASTVELLAALANLFKPVVIQAYQDYLAKTNGLADAPTIRLLKIALAEEEEALTLLKAAYRDLVNTPEKEAEAAAWVETLSRLLAAAGGVAGTQPAQPELLRPVRSLKPYAIPRNLARDETYTQIWDFVHVPNQNVAERLAQMMATRLAEVTAAEGLAYVLCETPDQPWSFYTDISRHLWDEIRHTLFGEVATEDIFGDRSTMPLRQFDADSVVQMTPLEIYAMLGIGVEAALMKYPPGKREEFEFCRDLARYPLMTTLQDFDWADEVLHVNIARRQLKEWFEGSQEELLKLAEQGVELRASMRGKQPPSPLPDVSRKLELRREKREERN